MTSDAISSYLSTGKWSVVDCPCHCGCGWSVPLLFMLVVLLKHSFHSQLHAELEKKEELCCLVAPQGQCSCHDVLAVLNILHQHLIRVVFGRPVELPGAKHLPCWTYSSAGGGRLGHAEPGCRDKAGENTQGDRVAAYVLPALRFHEALLMCICIYITVLSYCHLNLEVL